MRTFYFLRHGQTDWNVIGRMQGQSSDIPLNQTGLEQAKAAAKILSRYPIDRVISSPLKRAFVTAEQTSQALNVPIETDVRLLERNYGAIEGLTPEEINHASPSQIFEPDVPPDLWGFRLPRGAEPMEQLAQRGQEVVSDCLGKYPSETLLFVAHGAWFRALMHKLTAGKQIIRSDNATPYRCALAKNSWKIDQLRL